MTSPLETLTQINLDDLINALGIQNYRTLTRITRFVFQGAARKFAEQMIDFNSLAGTHGLAESARLTEQLYVRDVRVFGDDRLPDSAFLALSNHPGHDRYAGPLRRVETQRLEDHRVGSTIPFIVTKHQQATFLCNR